MKLAIIANPSAGRGKKSAFIDGFLSQIGRLGIEAEARITSAPGEATLLSRELARRADVLCVIGGDGTVHEVVNGIMPSPVPLVIVPRGTGNDFATLVDGPRNPRELLETLESGTAARLDVLEIGDRYGVNSAGLGFEGLVNWYSHQLKTIAGPMLYLAAVFRALLSFSCSEYRLTTDSGEVIEGRKLLVSVGNGNRSGGGFYLTPDAFPDDGLIDLCVVAPAGRRRILRLLPMTLRGAHTRYDEVSMRQVRSLEIESSTPNHLHIDGEYIGANENRLSIRLRHRVLPVLCRPNGTHRLVHAPEKIF